MAIDKADAFWIGNVAGIIILLVTVVIVAPQKERERKQHEAEVAAQNQKAKKTKESLQDTSAVKDRSSADDALNHDEKATVGARQDKSSRQEKSAGQVVAGTEVGGEHETLSVFFATTDIPVGSKITSEMASQRAVPHSSSNDHMLTRLTKDTIAAKEIKKGKPLLDTDVTISP